MAKYKATLVTTKQHKMQDDGVNYYVTFLAANPGQARQRLVDYFPGFVICDIKLMPEGKPDIQATFDFDVYGTVARVIGCTRQEAKFKILQEAYGLLPQTDADIPVLKQAAVLLTTPAAKQDPVSVYKKHCRDCSLCRDVAPYGNFSSICHEGMLLRIAAAEYRQAQTIKKREEIKHHKAEAAPDTKPYDPNKCVYCGDTLVCGQCMGHHMHTPEQLEEVIGCAGGIFCVCKPGWGHKSEWRETVFVCARHRHLKFPCALCVDKTQMRMAVSKGHLHRITADRNSSGPEL